MNTVIAFTPADVVSMVMMICGAITAVAAAAGVVAKVLERMKKPNQTQNDRLDMHEKHLSAIDAKFADYDRYFAADKKRLDSSEESNRVTQKALLALLTHAINGNNITELRDAENELREYLVKR